MEKKYGNIKDQDPEYEYNDDFNYDDDEFITKDEVGAFDRVTMTGNTFLCGGTTISGNIDELKKKIKYITQDPEEKFSCYVDAISRYLNSLGANISQTDINIMLDKVRYIKNIDKKNPTAYILGYITSKGGKDIEKKQFKYVVDKILPLVDVKNNITEPDILRYARLWLIYG
jgi:hypothetical protein